MSSCKKIEKVDADLVLREIRHELRSRISVIKGFFDALDGHQWGENDLNILYQASRQSLEKILATLD